MWVVCPINIPLNLMMDGGKNNNKYVSEFPLPPPHYLLFEGTDSDPNPPSLPPDSTFIDHYHKFVHNDTNINCQYDENKDNYRSVLKR